MKMKIPSKNRTNLPTSGPNNLPAKAPPKVPVKTNSRDYGMSGIPNPARGEKAKKAKNPAIRDRGRATYPGSADAAIGALNKLFNS